MAAKGLAANIIKFLTEQLENGDITEDSRESLEVAIQCLESAYNVQASDAPSNFNLMSAYKTAMENVIHIPSTEATEEEKLIAEKLKTEGNDLMKANKFHEAIVTYGKAIELDGRNAVYYCNRAAAYSKIDNHQRAIKDCQTALAIDPSYSKAYNRLGLAYLGLNQHKQATESYKKALEMEPDNESYKNNLQLAEEKLKVGASNVGLGANNAPLVSYLSSALSNPALLNISRQFMSDPNMQGVMTELMSGNAGFNERMEAVLGMGQQLASQIQNVNPELINSLERQMDGNQSDPDPSQQN